MRVVTCGIYINIHTRTLRSVSERRFPGCTTFPVPTLGSQTRSIQPRVWIQGSPHGHATDRAVHGHVQKDTLSPPCPVSPRWSPNSEQGCAAHVAGTGRQVTVRSGPDPSPPSCRVDILRAVDWPRAKERGHRTHQRQGHTKLDTHDHKDSALPHLHSWGGGKKPFERFHGVHRWKSQLIFLLAGSDACLGQTLYFGVDV